VLIGILIVLLLLVCLLAVPVTMTYSLSWKQSFSGTLKVRWAFGLVRFAASSDQSKSRPRKTPSDKPKAGRSARKSGNKANALAAFRQPAFRRRLMRFISDLWQALQKKNVRLRVRLGLGDPADTGRLWAVVGPISGLLAGSREVSIAMQPDFFEPAFELDSSGTLRLIPAQLTYLLLGLLVSPPFWRGVYRMRAPG